MRTKRKSHNLKKGVICLLIIVSMAVCAIPQSVKAENVNFSAAATAVKNYILQNGTYDSKGAYISESLQGRDKDYESISYDEQANTLEFVLITSDYYSGLGDYHTMCSFDYSLAYNTVKNNTGLLAIGVGSDVMVTASSNFSTNYRKGDFLSATVLKGTNLISSSQASNLMTAGFSAGMSIWNRMIMQNSNNKYNIGNLGFANYITPKNESNQKPDEPSKTTETPKNVNAERISMYRLYNPNSGEHFYTSSNSERQNLVKSGWRDEGIGWTAPKTSKTPVYRLYNPNAGDHHYTTKKSERDALVKAGWRYENIGWYSDDNHGKPLYRQYNPNAKTGTHNYTTSKSEAERLVKLGWRDEGIGWYGVA